MKFGLSGLFDCILVTVGVLEGLMYTGPSIVPVVLGRLILELSSLTESLLLCIFVSFVDLMTSDAPAKRDMDSDFLERRMNSGVLIPFGMLE